MWWFAMQALAQPVPVEVVQTDGRWALHRDGAPYDVRGAGGATNLDSVVAAGGTSIRTWGVDERTEALLDDAHAHGLTVAVGLWLGHPRHGFDYGDPKQVAAQLDEVRADVEALKNHPALLLWGLGNEMEGFEAGNDPEVWTAVCEAAAAIQQLDPHHPVMTTTAEVGGSRVPAVDACPHIDVHGINSYGGGPSLPTRYPEAGGRKPVLLTEFGPPGTWESPTTQHGASVERTSTEKAAAYSTMWKVIQDEPLFLGGYAFVWSHKTEGTATWYGLFLPDGTRLGGVDALADAWGQPVADRVPEVTPLVPEVEGPWEPGQELTVRWTAHDPEGGALTTMWALRPEARDTPVGGDAQGLPAVLPDAVLSAATDQATLRLPDTPGPYRLYAEVRDGAGGGATASLPIWVGEASEAPPVPMPWFVYQDAGIGGPWAPSGYMGSADTFELDLGWTKDCASPPTCIRLQSTGKRWSGVAWQTPANNWGDAPGGVDLSEARWLKLRVRGKYDVGTITIGAGLVDDPAKPHGDSLKVEKTIRLTEEWQEVRIRLRGDPSHLITGLWWVIPPQRRFTVYLDDIRFE